MIVRIFRAQVRPGKQAEWQRQVEDHSIPWMIAQEGMLGHFPGKPLDDGRDFVMVSLWKDIAAIEEAIGENWSQAILFEDEASLVEKVSVEHFETFGLDNDA